MLSRQSVLYGGDEISSSFTASGGGEGTEPRIKDTTPPCSPNNNNSNPDSNETRLCVRSEQFSPCSFFFLPLSLFSGSPARPCEPRGDGGAPAGELGAACELPGLNPLSRTGRALAARPGGVRSPRRPGPGPGHCSRRRRRRSPAAGAARPRGVGEGGAGWERDPPGRPSPGSAGNTTEGAAAEEGGC